MVAAVNVAVLIFDAHPRPTSTVIAIAIKISIPTIPAVASIPVIYAIAGVPPAISVAKASPPFIVLISKPTIAVSIAIAVPFTARPWATFVWSLRLRHRLRGGTRIRTTLLFKTGGRTASEKD